MQRAFEKILNMARTRSDVPGAYMPYAYVINMNELSEIVNQVASEYGGGWIPCSERLPEDNKPVLCWVRSTTIASGETFIIGSCSNNKFWFLQTYEIGHHHFPVKDYEVVAWCELPEPYKAEREDNA